MKIDCSKLSNKGDLLVLIALIFMVGIFCLIVYLAFAHTFLAGFVSATLVWKWQVWFYVPIDNLLEKHWPSDVR
jgi:hypothetical protein